jgi:hypothetical protein
MKALKSFAVYTCQLCQSPMLSERRGHQPCGPAELLGRAGGGRSCGGVLTISVKLSSVAGSFDM